ncbi:MAG: hypothetical protein RL885_13660 [Planctomycetota bacterium]
MNFALLEQEKAFLGEEFLTWLWFRTETGDGTFELPGGPAGLYFDDFLALRSFESQAHENILKKGTPTASAEASIALATGKKVVRAKMICARDSREWTFTLDAAGFRYSSVRCPALESDEALDRFLETASHFEELTEIIDSVFRIFLEERLSQAWESEHLPRVSRWIRERRQVEASMENGQD